MQIMKFGGTSLANAERLLSAARLVAERSRTTRVGLVVSAMAGITNALVECRDTALAQGNWRLPAERIAAQHATMIDALATHLPGLLSCDLRLALTEQMERLHGLLDGIAKLKVCPDSVTAQLLGLGECLSVRIMLRVLEILGVEVQAIDSADYLVTTGSLIEATPVLPELSRRFEALRERSAAVVLMAGFLASDESGATSLLGRNGSDYSAALMAFGLQAELCEIWTDVDGVYSADPRRVSDAMLIEEMSYEEAMELSFFGAKVLHPKTIAPIAMHRIPTLIRNSLNPAAPGTRIHAHVEKSTAPVRGLSCLERIALINVSGSGMKGVPGMAARLFAAVSQRNISVVLITQASSEYSISFCVDERDAKLALRAIHEAFALEIDAGLIAAPECRHNQVIISPVGDGMCERRGVAGRFFAALASADTNVVAISQGSSERAISAVVDGADGERALKTAHQFFFNTTQRIDIFLVGIGAVGSAFLEQIRDQQPELRKQGIDVRVIGIANSRQFAIGEEGLDLSAWRTSLDKSVLSFELATVISLVQRLKPLHPVFVDCTSNDMIAGSYAALLTAGLHVVTPNKKSNSADFSYYQSLRRAANQNRRRFLYETTVGAGLPVIDTLQNLIKSGDRLDSFAGILSGSLSFVFGLLEEGVPFSQAVAMARQRQFTEPDPREDLSGMDVARKLLILLREAGGRQELHDITIAPVFPASFELGGGVDEFMARLPEVDDYFSEWMQRLAQEGKVLRFAAEISGAEARVGLISVDSRHPLFTIKGGENALAFTTRRYTPIPLVIRGYGAGAEVTAGGVFGDILRIVAWHAHGEEA